MPDTPGQEGAKGHMPNLPEIRVLSTVKSLKKEPFKIPEVGRAWREWIEDKTNVFQNHRNKRLCERPEDLWWQRNQETCM